MSDKEQGDEPLFKNQDTIRRRAWIDRALAGVRSRLEPEADKQAGEDSGESHSGQNGVEGPRLYVVRNGRSAGK